MEDGVESWVRSGPGAGPVLAVETSTDRACVALGLPDGTILVAPPGEPRRHGRGLVPSLRDLLREAGLRPGDLARVGVGLGPGSFTGLRIGLTAVKTLAYALELPLVGLDSFEVIARNAPGDALRVSVVADAQRAALFVADFARDAPGGPLRLARATRLEPVADWPASVESGTLVLGPTLPVEPDWPEAVVRGDPSLGYPDGRRLIELAVEGRPLSTADAWLLEPNYGRRGAAEEKAARLA